MVEGERWVRPNVAGGVVELDDLDPVGVVFEETGYGETVLFVSTNAPVHGEDVPWRLVCVDL